MKVYALDEYPEELKKALEDSNHARVDLDKVVGGVSTGNCSVQSQYFAEYAVGQGNHTGGATAEGAGQCLGVNQLVPGWCIVLDQNSAAFGCAFQCNI